MHLAHKLAGIKSKDGFVECEFCEGPHEPNFPLLRKVLDEIRAHPETWFQGSWTSKIVMVASYDADTDQLVQQGMDVNVCGTAYCIAGHAVAISGYTINVGAEMAAQAEGPYYGISDVAKHELGLSNYEASTLFNGDNNWEDVKAIVAAIAEAHGEVF